MLKQKLGQMIGATLRAVGNSYMLSPRCQPLLSGLCRWAREEQEPDGRGSVFLTRLRIPYQGIGM
jgi:hypothetical protein